MVDKMSITEKLVEIPIEKIYVGEGNVRKREVEKNLDELKESIRRVGLLQPIIVFPKGDKYELIVGQRRFLAVQALGWKTVPAIVVGSLDLTKAKIISGMENFHRKELPYKDTVDLCDYLYEKYGSIKAVAEELGISEGTVRNYLAHKLVPEPIKQMVEEKKISRQDALAITKATLPDIAKGNEEKAVKLAKQIAEKQPPREEKKRIIETAEDHPELSPEKVIEEAKKPPERVKLVIHLPGKYGKALDSAAEDLDQDPEEVAKTAIIDWLTARGYA